MKVTFLGGLAQYWKPEVKPEQYESLSEGLIPRSELIVYAKTDGIDPKCADWWSPWDKETSRLFVVVLDMCNIMAPVTYHDVLIIKKENGADVIKAVEDIGVSFNAETYFSAGLREDRVGTRDEAVIKIEFVKRLTNTDWNYYMDLMHRSDKALKLYHSYAESEKEEQADTKKGLRPKLAWPIVVTVLLLILWLGFDFFDSKLILWISCFLALSAWINVVVKLVRYMKYKP